MSDDIDKDGYVRIHQHELGQLIKYANGAFNMSKDEISLIGLAHRDLVIQIEKLVVDRDMFKADWQAMIKQIEQLEHEVKRLRRTNAV